MSGRPLSEEQRSLLPPAVMRPPVLPKVSRDRWDYLTLGLMGFFNGLLTYGAYEITQAYKKEPNPTMSYSEGWLTIAGLVNSISEIPMGYLASLWWMTKIFREASPGILYRRLTALSLGNALQMTYLRQRRILFLKDALGFSVKSFFCILTSLHLYSTVRKADFNEQFSEFAISIYLINYFMMNFYIMTLSLMRSTYYFLLCKNWFFLPRYFFNFGQVSDQALEVQAVLIKLHTMVQNHYEQLELSEALDYLFKRAVDTHSINDFRLANIRAHTLLERDPIEQHYTAYCKAKYFGRANISMRERVTIALNWCKWASGMICAFIVTPAILYTRLNAAADSFVLIGPLDFCNRSDFTQWVAKVGSSIPTTIFVAMYAYSFFVSGHFGSLMKILLKPPFDLLCPDWIRRRYVRFGLEYDPLVTRSQSIIKNISFGFAWLGVLGFTGIVGFAAFIMQSLIVSGIQQTSYGPFCNASLVNQSISCVNGSSVVRYAPCNNTESVFPLIETLYQGREHVELSSSLGISFLSLGIVADFYATLQEQYRSRQTVAVANPEEKIREAFLRFLSICINLFGKCLDESVQDLPVTQGAVEGREERLQHFFESWRSLAQLVAHYEAIRLYCLSPSRNNSQALPGAGRSTPRDAVVIGTTMGTTHFPHTDDATDDLTY